MSNELAIAGVTRALWARLNQITTTDFSALPEDARPTNEIEVTMLPLDRVREENDERNQVNLFLYQIEPNVAWRNMDLPPQPQRGDVQGAPLALNLKYIITAYAQEDSELIAHVLFGTAIRILHEHPVLSREELAAALALSELDTQFERVRITPETLSLEDSSNLWTGFQSEFRLSAAYKASVVLIENRRPLRTALPVLRRGSEDRGPVVVPLSTPSLTAVREIFDPTLAVRPPSGKPAAQLGDTLVLTGTNLQGDGISVRFRHPLVSGFLARTPLPGSSGTELHVGIPSAVEDPDTPGRWPIGIYSVDAHVQRPPLPPWATNRVAFGLAPSITLLNPLVEAVGNVPFDLTIECVPQVRERQSVSLLLGDREFRPESVTTPAGDLTAPSTLVFHVTEAVVGEHVVRLRVDGVDSIPVDFSVTPPAFDPNQQVTITP